MDQNLSIIIPVYNEEKRIFHTLIRLRKFLKLNHIVCEIIVVDDGSTDKTLAILQSFYRQIKILPTSPNKGKGAAVKTGILSAKGDYILFMDADLATSLKEIPQILEDITEVDADIAIGSRNIDLLNVKRTPLRLLVSKIFHFISNLLIPLDYTDTQCGFKLFKREIAQEIFKKTKINRWAFDLEVLFIADLMNAKVIECSVEWQDMAGSKLRIFRDAFFILKDMLKVRLYDFLGVYSQQENLAVERKYDVLPEQSTKAKEL
jgi:dolichyl-phosphate beta-glucosyltransferase